MNKKQEQVLPMEIIALNWGGIEEPDSFILSLKEKNGDRIINMIISWLDAQYISSLLDKIEMTIPSIHDIMNKIINDFNIQINSVVINALTNNTFFAEIILNNGKSYQIKPTDAIIIGLKNNLDILIDEKIIDKIGIHKDEFFAIEDLDESEREEFNKFIENQNNKIISKPKIQKIKFDETHISDLIKSKDFEAAEIARFNLIKQYEEDLNVLEKEENYEKACKLRDKIIDLKKIKI